MMTNPKTAAIAALLVCAGTALGQSTIQWAAPVDGVFDEATNWFPAAVPGTTDTAVLGGMGPYAVMADTSRTVFALLLPNPDAVLAIGNGRLFTIGNDGIAHGPGTIVVNATGGTSTTRLQLRGGATLDAMVVLNTPAASSPGLRSQVTALEPAVIGTAGVLTGRGRIAGAFLNWGLLEAAGPEAELQLARADIEHPGGVGGVRAIDGGRITLIDSRVQGAAWDATGGGSGGVLGGSNGVIADPLFEGDWAVLADSRLTLEGHIAGGGALLFDPAPAAIASIATIADGTLLDLDIDLGFRGGLVRQGTGVATIGPGCTITGRGSLEGRFDLLGSLIADGADSEFFWTERAGQFGPDAQILAANGGAFTISGEPLADAMFQARDGARFRFGCDLMRPVFSAEGVGAWIDNATLVLDPSFEGPWRITATSMRIEGTVSGPGRIDRLERELRTVGDVFIDIPIHFFTSQGGIAPHTAGAGVVTLGSNVVLDGNGTLRGEYRSRAFFDLRARRQSVELDRCHMVMEGGGRVVIADESTLSLRDATLETPMIEAADTGRIAMAAPALISDGALVSDGGTALLRGDSDACVLADARLDGRWGVDNGSQVTLAGDTTSPRGDGELIVNAPSLSSPCTLWLAEDAIVDVPIALNMAPTTSQFFVARLARTGGGVAELGPNSALTGRGQVVGSYRIAGKISPGGQPASGAGGVGTIDRILLNQADIQLTPSARVTLELAGPSDDQRDRMDGIANVQLDGALRVRFVDGFEPGASDRIDILRVSSIEGAFASYDIEGITGPAAGVGPAHVVYADRTATLVICAADRDGDGELTVFDFLAFQNQFAAGDPRADIDGDGSLTIFDFLAFQNAFDAGCP